MSRASKRLRQLYHEIREHGASTEWIADADLQVLKEHWASEEFKKKSKINSTSRRSSKGGSVHTGGSVTIETTRLKMTKELGRPPTHSELFRDTHTRKHDKSVWVDARSENTHTNYVERLQEAKERQIMETEERGIPVTDLPPVDEMEIWKKTVGGDAHGYLYGMGIHYAHQSSSSMASDGATFENADVSRVAALEKRLEEQEIRHQEEMRKYQEEMCKYQEEMMRKYQDDMRSMEQRMMSTMQSYITHLQVNISGAQLFKKATSQVSPMNDSQGNDNDDTSDEDYDDDFV